MTNYLELAMDNTPFSKKCEILNDFYMDYANTDRYVEFFLLNDLGIPAALLYMNGGAEITEIGTAFIDETWRALCELLQVDYMGDYPSLEYMIDLNDE
jgi:hypothetical protein